MLTEVEEKMNIFMSKAPCTLFVGNLPKSVTEEQLKEVFGSLEKYWSVKLINHNNCCYIFDISKNCSNILVM